MYQPENQSPPLGEGHALAAIRAKARNYRRAGTDVGEILQASQRLAHAQVYTAPPEAHFQCCITLPGIVVYIRFCQVCDAWDCVQSARQATACRLLPPVHWALLYTIGALFVSTFILFETGGSFSNEGRHILFTVLCGLMSFVLVVRSVFDFVVVSYLLPVGSKTCHARCVAAGLAHPRLAQVSRLLCHRMSKQVA